MRSVSATEAKQNLAAVLDTAQREPVVIRRHDRDVAVILSAEEYERLRALRVAEFQRFCDQVAEKAAARGMTPEILEQLLSNEDPPAPGH
jgi:prevent-host-death family protein